MALGGTALVWTSLNGQYEICELLLEQPEQGVMSTLRVDTIAMPWRLPVLEDGIILCRCCWSRELILIPDQGEYYSNAMEDTIRFLKK